MKRHFALVTIGAVLLGAGAPAAGEVDPGVKTIDATNIEGEIRLPQVLFITSRESERPLDWLDLYAPLASLEIGREAPLPNRIHVVRLEQLEGADPDADPEGSPETDRTPEEESP